MPGHSCRSLNSSYPQERGNLMNRIVYLIGAVVVSGKPAALYPTGIRIGTISSMFNTMEIGHGWDGRKTIA